MSRKASNATVLTIRALGLRCCRSRDGEYRVAYANDCEATAYYTQWPEDAVGTAKAMLAHNVA